MKVFVIIVATMVSLVLSHENTTKRTAETQIQKNEIDYQIDDKTTIIHLSSTVNAITSHLVKIIENIGTSFADDLELLVHPLEDVISFVWSAPMDKSLQENLYFLFDKILNIVYCIYEMLDDVWHGVSYVIESKLSQISMHILQIVDEMKTLGGQSEDNDTVAKFTKIKRTIIDLTTSIVGLTSITTSVAQLITTRDRSISLIIGNIASLILIHQYAVAAVACILSRAVKVINSLAILHTTGIAILEATIVNFISTLEPILRSKPKETEMTQLFHGDLHTKLSMQLLISMNGLMMGAKMTNTIYETTTSLLTIIQEYAPREFHVLPDLIGQLTVISLRCGHTKFDNLERFITYAFDGLFDVLHHISYKLDRHIQSSASTGSFQEPSEPIDVAVANVRTDVKRFIHDCRQISKSDTEEFTEHLIASTSDLMKALLDPMNIVIRKSGDDYSITLASSLQFIALYVVGLILTPLISVTKNLPNFTTTSDNFSNFGATLSLVFIKIEMIFDYSKTANASEQLDRLYASFDDLFQDLTQLKGGSELSRRSTSSRNVNPFDQFVLL